MDKAEFENLLVRIDDLLIDVDYWRQQITDCKECQGWAEEDPQNMCPSCRAALEKELKALKKISANDEMRMNMTSLKEALENDTTGELVEIFRQSRNKRHE